MPGWNNVIYSPVLADGTTLTYNAHWPPVSGDVWVLWSWTVQLWQALGERYAILGAYTGTDINWPPSNTWDSGHIDSAVDNGDGTVTFSMTLTAANLATWTVSCGADSPPPYRWIGYVCIPHGTTQKICVPEEYDLVIDPAGALVDPTKIFRDQIRSMTLVNHGGSPATGTGTLTTYIGNITDMITAGRISALSDLVGKRWYIVTSAEEGGVYASDRLPIKPLGRTLWQSSTGSIGTTGPWPADQKAYLAAVAAATTAGTDPPPPPTQYSILQDSKAGWGTDRWKTKEVLFQDIRLKRLTLVHNDGQNLYFASGTYSTTGNVTYCIVEPGTVADPNWPSDCPIAWYAGDTDQYLSHSVNDISNPYGAAVLAAPTIDITVLGADDECDAIESPGVFDQPDLTYDPENICECSKAYLFYNPYFWKSLHAIQVGILGICPSFVPAKDYTNATAIPNYTPATLLKDLGATYFTSSVSIVGGSVTFPTDPAVAGKGCYYTVFTSTGDIALIYPAYGIPSTSNVITTTSTDTTLAGALVIYSPGFTRKYKRRVKYFYNTVGNFIPDLDDTGAPIDPPIVKKAVDADGDTLDTYDPNGAGIFIKRFKSTKYALYDQFGELQDNAGPSFVDGDLVCHEGDSMRESPMPPKTLWGSPAPPLTGYYDRMFRGTYAPELQGKRNASKSGKLLGTTKFSIRTDQHWWNDGVNAGTMRTEQSTATSGSATTLTDTSRNTADHTLPYFAWYDPNRFSALGTSGPYVGFILEVDKAYTGTDLAVDATDNTKVSSASHTFTYPEVGVKLTISGGTGWTAGDYIIKSIDSGGAAVLSKSPAAVSTSGGSWNMAVTYKQPITSFIDHAGTGGVTFGFGGLDGFTVAAGDAWRIKETYCLDKWEDRDLALTWIDDTGATQQLITPIVDSDDDTLYFAAQSTPIPITASWLIREKSYGSVWKRQNSPAAWLVPPKHPTDIAPTDQTEQRYQHAIEPTYVTDYGNITRGDYPALKVFQEMYNGINRLLWQKKDFSWTNKPSLMATPEKNVRQGSFDDNEFASDAGGYNGGRAPTSTAIEWAGQSFSADGDRYQFDDSGGDPTYLFTNPAEADNSPPSQSASISAQLTFPPNTHGTGPDGLDIAGASCSGIYSYGVISGLATIRIATADFYIIGDAIAGVAGFFTEGSDTPGFFDSDDNYYTFGGVDGGLTLPGWTLDQVLDTSYTGPGARGKVSKWATASADSDGNIYSGATLGPTSSSPPNFVKPSTFLPDSTWYVDEGSFPSGYQVASKFAILKWSFNFIDPTLVVP